MHLLTLCFYWLIYDHVIMANLNVIGWATINVPVKSKLKHPPPPRGIPRAFDVFSCPGGREFD